MNTTEIDIKECIEIIEKRSTSFLEWVKDVFQPGPYKEMRAKTPDFQILSPANKYYFEYSYFVECIEWYIRDELANGIICDLCNLYGLACKVPNTTRKYVRFSNESIERVRPFEFIIVQNNKAVGYRYASIDTDKRYIKRLLRQYKLDQIVIIDWKEDTPTYQKHFNRDIPTQIESVVSHIHVRDFFLQYFSAEVYKEYMNRTRQAVERSHEEISIQVSPTMSLQFLAQFKTEKKNWLSEYSFRGLHYLSAELNELPQLQEADYNAIDASFLGDKLYRALIGKERFAESFITSEYMFNVFENGGRFDYTAIVCGYIKSIEQLLAKLMDITLSYHVTDNLWIKCNHRVRSERIDNVKYKSGIVCPKHQNQRNSVHVRALTINKSEFDTTFTPLTWFIYDNASHWNISADGIDRINDYLLEYAKEDRNEHFHKDNINEIDDVKRIRNNTILLLYLLLGGYQLTGNPDTDFYELGIQDDSYDRLYNRLISIPTSMKKFVLSFDDGEEIKAERLYEQERPSYDLYGGVTSTIKFSLVESSNATDYEEFVKNLTDDDVIVLSRTYFPEKVWFVKHDGERVSVEW